jgi:hypothetical protein
MLLVLVHIHLTLSDWTPAYTALAGRSASSIFSPRACAIETPVYITVGNLPMLILLIDLSCNG